MSFCGTNSANAAASVKPVAAPIKPAVVAKALPPAPVPVSVSAKPPTTSYTLAQCLADIRGVFANQSAAVPKLPFNQAYFDCAATRADIACGRVVSTLSKDPLAWTPAHLEADNFFAVAVNPDPEALKLLNDAFVVYSAYVTAQPTPPVADILTALRELRDLCKTIHP